MKPIVGVWYGEFGWELACWQGYLRKLSKDRPVHVVCPNGHEYLYSDFAAFVQPHETKGDRDCWRLNNNNAGLIGLIEQTKKYADSIVADTLYPRGPVALTDQVFIRFGISASVQPADRFDILLHARHRSERGFHRNTDMHQVAELVAMLPEYRIASIGSKAEAKHVDGTTDLRGIPLSVLSDYMAAAGVVVGPASGPSVLALLCGVPGVVWSDSRKYSAIHADNEERLKTLWNPFKTPVRVLQSEGFNPPPAISAKAVQETIRKCRT